MSKQSWQPDEPAESEKPARPLDPAPDPTVPIRTTESDAAPRRPRRRIDPDGEALHTGSTAKSRPPIEDLVNPPAVAAGATAAGVTPPGATTPPSALPNEPLEDSFEDAAAARAKARERAVVGSPVAARVIQVVLAILAPLVILVGVIRLVASPVFLWFEYHRPGFPPDLYGMDTEQRLTLGSYGLDYLFNLAPPAYLADLRFANGNPVFNAAEVAHMVDVKQVMWGTMIGGLVAAVICVVLIVLLYRMRKGAIARSLFAGALWFTIALTLLAIVAVFGWEAFFTGFHQVFFADGTWTFSQTDSLIRLYPGQFWIDAAAWIAGITLAIMIITMLLTAPTGRRRYRNEQAQRFMESQVLGDGSTGRTQP